MLPPEVRVVGGRLRRTNRETRRRVESRLVLPATLRPASRRRGSIWAVTMMRNEAETARHVIEHLLDQGIDTILVADNNSTDETMDVLATFDKAQVHVAVDPSMAYEQSVKMTVLSEIARRSGADWIVPFDADELWFADGGRTVGEMLRACDADVVRAQLHNVFPGVDDDATELDPFLRLHRIDTEPAEFSKVAFRSQRLVRLDMGNLDVVRRGRRTDGLFIAHYPWRSLDHLSQKVRHGRTAMAATNMPEQMASHWRVVGAWSDDQIAAAWAELVAGRPVPELAWTPRGALQQLQAGRWRTWELG